MIKYLLISLFILFSNLFANEQIINFDTIKKDGKQTMIFFHMNHCSYCERMKNKTLEDKNIKKIIQKDFLFVDINISDQYTIIFNNKTYSIKEFTKEIEVEFFPTILFLDEENEIIYKARGYRTIEKFQHILNYMKTKEFEEMSFFEYLENLDKE